MTGKDYFIFSCDLEFSPKSIGRFNLADEKLLVGLSRLSDLLRRFEVKCTFFTQGAVCGQCPELVEDLHKLGHEIGSHGFDHIPMKQFWLSDFSPHFSTLAKRRNDIRKSKVAIQSLTKEKPVSFRAPYLAIDSNTLSILEEEGFLFDSSLYNPAFGKTSSPYHPSNGNISVKGGMKIFEVPASVSIFPQKKLFYYRYPLILSMRELAMRKTISRTLETSEKNPRSNLLFVTIVHPYELCSDLILARISSFLDFVKDKSLNSITFRELKEYLKENDEIA